MPLTHAPADRLDAALSPRLEAALLVCLSIAFLTLPLLFFADLDFDYLTADTLAGALRPVSEILSSSFPDQSPLFYLLLHAWTGVFGPSELSVRLLNGLTALGALYYCHRWTKYVFGSAALGLVAATLLAVAGGFLLVVWYCRLYALFMSLSMMAVYHATRYGDDRRSLDLVLFTIASWLAIHTHLWALGTTGLLAAYLVWRAGSLARARALLFALALLTLGSVWQLGRSVEAVRFVTFHSPQALSPFSPAFFAGISTFLWNVPSTLEEQLTAPPDGFLDVVRYAFLGLTVVLVALSMRRARLEHRVLIGLYLGGPPLAIAVAAIWLQVEGRYFSFMLPMVFPCLVAGLWPARDRSGSRAGPAFRRLALLAIAAMVVVDAGFMVSSLSDPRHLTEGFRNAGELFRPGDAVAVHPSRLSNAHLLSPLPPVPALSVEALRLAAGPSGRVVVVTWRPQTPGQGFVARIRRETRVRAIKTAGPLLTIATFPGSDFAPVAGQLKAWYSTEPGVRLRFAGSFDTSAPLPELRSPLEAVLREGGAVATHDGAWSQAEADAGKALGLSPLTWTPGGVGLASCVAGPPAVCLLTMDLRDLTPGRLEEAGRAIQDARRKGLVVAIARWPDGWRAPTLSARSTAEALARAGAAAVLGAGTSEAGPVWWHEGAFIAPWPGRAARPKKSTPWWAAPDGVVLELHFPTSGTLSAALAEVSSDGTGPDPWGHVLRQYRLDAPARAGQDLDTASVDPNGQAPDGWAPPSERRDLVADAPDGDWRRSWGELRWTSALVPGTPRTFDVPSLGDRLEGFFGSIDAAFDSGEPQPIRTLELRIDGRKVLTVPGAESPGWHHFRVETGNLAGRRAKLELTLAGPTGSEVFFGLAQVRVPPVVGLSGLPVKMSSSGMRGFVEAALRAEEEVRFEGMKALKYYLKADGWEVHRYGNVRYPLPAGWPTFGGLGALADEGFREKVRLLERPADRLPPTPAGAWRLRDHLREAVVEFLYYEGSREVCSSWSEQEYYLHEEERGPDGEGQFQGHWRCGGEAWRTVAQVRQRAGGELRDALWMHPLDNGVLQTTFPDVPLEASLEGFYGLTDLVLDKGDYPIYVEVWIGGLPVLRRTVDPARAGWQAFTIDTRAWKGMRADVAVRVETDKQRWRHFCLDAVTSQRGTSPSAP